MPQENKKASLNVKIDFEFLKRYSRESIVIKSLTNANPSEFDENPWFREECQFDASKIPLVLKKLKKDSVVY